MSLFALLFEISDKVSSVQGMYFVFIILGLIGLILGFYRWWASVIWLFFPTSFIAFGEIVEINNLYQNIIQELGKSYIWHTYISVIIGVLINIAGIFVSLIKPRKIKLK
jgi:hypothetical protein